MSDLMMIPQVVVNGNADKKSPNLKVIWWQRLCQKHILIKIKYYFSNATNVLHRKLSLRRRFNLARLSATTR